MKAEEIGVMKHVFKSRFFAVFNKELRVCKICGTVATSKNGDKECAGPTRIELR